MDISLVEKWLEQGERIEARYLNVFKKNKANSGMTDGSDYFRLLYYHFDQLNDAQVQEAISILNGFQRGKASGAKGREVVKDFLSNCLTLLSNSQDRQALKQYLDKNGKMPVDNSEERRRQEEDRRIEQQRYRHQQEEEKKRRLEEQQRRQRDQERRQREEEQKQEFENNRRDSEKTNQDKGNYTTGRKSFWSGVFKTLLTMLLLYLLFLGIKNTNSCSSNTDLSSEQVSAANEDISNETVAEEQNKGSRDTKNSEAKARTIETTSKTRDETFTESVEPSVTSTSSVPRQDNSPVIAQEKPAIPSLEMSDMDLVAQGEKAIHSMDYSLAKKYLTLAANHGNIEAMYQLGLLYSNNNYDDYNRKSAANYFVKAANNRHVEAMYQAGMMYLGIDNSAAKLWLRKASEQGHDRAKAQLSRLK